ncbi:MAG: 3-oxoacyl-ACP reductase FabG [Deltaproteobacteria bacterium]|nr:3-oxoacyl-ACP reductase FabG [Mailhella sp.]MBR5997993.1 3-oxoacyl-ACP reductase FabG [Deltaproteobacteria bacterium]
MRTDIALITGASKGIGRAIALGLAQDGFDIWLNYRNDDAAAAATQAKITALGRQCTLVPFDVSDRDAVHAALEPLLEQTTPYILVNNAGFARDSIFGLMDEDDWRQVMDVHLNGFFHVTRSIVPLMQRARRGRIINIASASGQAGVAGQANYSAAKAGLIGATKALARELARRNVLVNAVAPGFIATDMTKDLPVQDYLPLIPQGRMGTPEDVAGCVRFLCSDMASYVTGQTIAVNGGLYM